VQLSIDWDRIQAAAVALGITVEQYCEASIAASLDRPQLLDAFVLASAAAMHQQ
jgi:hypothetical protein